MSGEPATGGVWPFTRSPILFADPIAQGVIATVLLSVLFLAVPQLDLWVSGLFYKEGAGFLVSELDAFRLLRRLGRYLLAAALVAMLAVVVVKLVLPDRRTLVDPRHLLFSLGVLAIAPGIVVNGIFKSYWGRPRPLTVEAFGGDLPFVGVWDITDHCARNCSFVSGEGSAALWLVTLVVVLPAAWQARAVVAVLVLAFFLSLNRVAFGGHFLSDVLLSWAMTLTVIGLLHRLIYVHPPAWLRGDSLEARLTGFAKALRRPFARSSDRP